MKQLISFQKRGKKVVFSTKEGKVGRRQASTELHCYLCRQFTRTTPDHRTGPNTRHHTHNLCRCLITDQRGFHTLLALCNVPTHSLSHLTLSKKPNYPGHTQSLTMLVAKCTPGHALSPGPFPSFWSVASYTASCKYLTRPRCYAQKLTKAHLPSYKGEKCIAAVRSYEIIPFAGNL